MNGYSYTSTSGNTSRRSTPFKKRSPIGPQVNGNQSRRKRAQAAPDPDDPMNVLAPGDPRRKQPKAPNSGG